MTCEEARAWLDQVGELRIRLGLDRIQSVLSELDHPERAYAVVHVAGTNGKGTVAWLTDAMLRNAGLRCGRYTSPHLRSPSERICIDGEPVSDDVFAALATEVRNTCERLDVELTYFEILTVMALMAFRRAEVQVAVLEVGLGGRLDATNVVQAPAATVITEIGLDHTDFLGDTLEAVAAEKAGIIKPGSLVVCSTRNETARRVIAERAAEVGAPAIYVHEDFGFRRDELLAPGERVEDVPVAMPGAHNRDNAAAAAAAAWKAGAFLGHPMSPEAIRAACADVRVPGRMQHMDGLLLDGGHNPSAARQLALWLDEQNTAWVLVFASMANKDIEGTLRALSEAGTPRAVYFTRTSGSRAASLDRLARACPAGWPEPVLEADPWAALEQARAGEDLVVVTGSFYLVGTLLERGL